MKKKIDKRVLLLMIIVVIILLITIPLIGNKLLKNKIWGIKDAEIDTITIKMDDKDLSIKLYRDHYTDKTEEMDKEISGIAIRKKITINQYENAYVTIYVPEGVDIKDDVPIIYKLYNNGWRMNEDKILFEEDGEYYSKDNIVNKAIKEGYIVVTAGARIRGAVDKDGNYNHSSVSVADAKAVIRYLRYNNIGNTDKIIVTGESGGAGLALALGSNGNSSDFDEELKKIGAVENEIDNVFAVVSYCGVTSLGVADYDYEYTYAKARQALIEGGFSNDTSLSKTSLNISGILASYYPDYINSLGLKNEEGKDLNAYFDEKTLISSGTLYEGMKKLIIESLQRGLDSSDSIEDFYAIIDNVDEYADRNGNDLYGNGNSEKNWNNSKTWITIKNGKITDIDLEKYIYYVSLSNALKLSPAVTNDGTTVESGMNENNLFGAAKDEYGYLSESVWDLEKDGEKGVLHSKYGSWENYWSKNKDLLQKQVRMVDSISYLVDNEGKDAGDSAPYWWVRNASLDRDISFANQALLYYALLNDETIKDFDYEIAFNRKHSFNFEVEEAWNYIQSIVK